VHFCEEIDLVLELLLKRVDVFYGAFPLSVQTIHLLCVFLFESFSDALVLQFCVSVELLFELAQNRVDFSLAHLHHFTLKLLRLQQQFCLFGLDHIVFFSSAVFRDFGFLYSPVEVKTTWATTQG